MIDKLNALLSLLEEEKLPKEKVIAILGPTASGKTKLATALAQRINAEIISADSRQVYRRMDIGTGKDLSEYGDIPYHLIDIREPGEQYHLGNFITDFQHIRKEIFERNKHTILCGGTGLYLQSAIQQNPYALVPTIVGFKERMQKYTESELTDILYTYQRPKDFHIDTSTIKRIIRAIEILEFLSCNADYSLKKVQKTESFVVGLNPPLDIRRKNISFRLHERLKAGLLHEVKQLLNEGISHEQLQYYGLEYKYASFYLQGRTDFSTFVKKLETEIHRYAKRQMTYFRKMEKDGIKIHWL